MDESEAKNAAAKQLSNLKRRHDDLNSECVLIRSRLILVSDRKERFLSKEDLDMAASGTKQIERLHAELEELNSAARSVYSRCMTYQQMINRLKAEGRTYRSDLCDLYSTSKTKGHDCQILQLMLKDASRVRDMARTDLNRSQEAVTEQMRRRQNYLQEHRRKLDAQLEASDEHDKESVARSEAVLAQREYTTSVNSDEESEYSIVEEREHIFRFEAQLAQIKEMMAMSSVAGVSEIVDEVVDTFKAQETTHATLGVLSVDAQQRTEAHLQARDNAKRVLEMARYVEPVATAAAAAVAGGAKLGAEKVMNLDVEAGADIKPALMGFDACEAMCKERQVEKMQLRQRKQRLSRLSAVLVKAHAAVEHFGTLLDTATQLPHDVHLLMPEPGPPSLPPELPRLPPARALRESAKKSLEEDASGTRAELLRVPEASAEAQQSRGLNEAELGEANLGETLELQVRLLCEMHESIAKEDACKELASSASLASPVDSTAYVWIGAQLLGDAEVRAVFDFDAVVSQRAEIFAQGATGGVLGPVQEQEGPIFQRTSEKMHIKNGAGVEEEEEEEEDSAGSAADWVLDRKTLKRNSERVLKKRQHAMMARKSTWP